MILKIFRAVWFLSVLAALANLLYTYAGLSAEEVIVQEEAAGAVTVNKELLFYFMTGVIVLVNVLVYVIGKTHARMEDFRAWFHGQIVTINIFLIIAMNLVQTYNSGERFDFSAIGFIIYGSVILVIGWAVSWPLLMVYRKFFPKPAIS